MNNWRRWIAWVLTAALALGTVSFASAAGTVGAAGAEVEAPAHLQVIADESAVEADGKWNLHLIYHNVDNKARTNTQLNVKIHDLLEVVDAGGAEWDAAQSMLKWHVKDTPANGATVFHFQLKVKGNAKTGDEVDVEGEVELEGGVKWKTPKIKAKVGTVVHQPFMQGYPDGLFRPDGSLTRAETAAMIARIDGLRAAEAAPYEDVPTSHWAYRYIQQVSADGYMVGFDGKFRPDEPITKAELIVLMLRLHGIVEAPFDSPFEDVKGHWSRHALGTAHALGYVKQAVGGGKAARFLPDVAISRKEAAQWLSIGLQRGPLKDGETDVAQHFPDVPANHPYFEWIEEASAVAHEAKQRGEGVEHLVRYLPEQTAPF